MPQPLEIEHLHGPHNSQVVLCLKGPLTLDNLAEFQNAVRRETSPTIILDFSEVPYMDSSGLGSLVSAQVTGFKLGHRMALAGVNQRVLQLLEITRLEKLFLIFSELEDAIEALSRPAVA